MVQFLFHSTWKLPKQFLFLFCSLVEERLRQTGMDNMSELLSKNLSIMSHLSYFVQIIIILQSGRRTTMTDRNGQNVRSLVRKFDYHVLLVLPVKLVSFLFCSLVEERFRQTGMDNMFQLLTEKLSIMSYLSYMSNLSYFYFAVWWKNDWDRPGWTTCPNFCPKICPTPSWSDTIQRTGLPDLRLGWRKFWRINIKVIFVLLVLHVLFVLLVLLVLLIFISFL